MDYTKFLYAAIESENLSIAREALSDPRAAPFWQSANNLLLTKTAALASPPEAITIALRISDPGDQVNALIEIARRNGPEQPALAKTALDRALSVAAGLPQFRTRSLVDVAWVQLSLGDVPAARQTLALVLSEAERTTDTSDQLDAWIGAAEINARMGEFDRALSLALRLPDPDNRAFALRSICYRVVWRNRTDLALRWAERSSVLERNEALFGIAAALYEQLSENPGRLSAF